MISSLGAKQSCNSMTFFAINGHAEMGNGELAGLAWICFGSTPVLEYSRLEMRFIRSKPIFLMLLRSAFLWSFRSSVWFPYFFNANQQNSSTQGMPSQKFETKRQ